MCQSCLEIDGKIEHYQKLRRLIADLLTIESIDQLIADLEIKKDALHPAPEKS
jgi:hypothetical protein